MHLISLYQNKRQKNAFNTFKNSKWNSLWFFNYLLFTRLSLLLLARWQFFCLYWPFLWQKSRIFILHLAFFEHKPGVSERQYSFVKNFIAEERYICIIQYILYACFGYSTKNSAWVLRIDLTLWNTCNISMHTILIKRKKGKKRKKNIQFTTFRNTCNITR